MRIRTLGLLIALLGGCAHGVGGREYWRGTSTGSSGECAPLAFDITIRDAQVEGWASSTLPQGSAMWEVRGSVARDDRVSIETTTQDPRLAYRRLTWTGRWGRLELSLEQAGPPGCQPPRTVKLGHP